jgi:hypothetical protein
MPDDELNRMNLNLRESKLMNLTDLREQKGLKTESKWTPGNLESEFLVFRSSADGRIQPIQDEIAK